MADDDSTSVDELTFITGGGLDLISVDDGERGSFTGQSIDDYLVGELLGSGGFGEVYMAEQLAPVMRTVAFKVLKAGMDSSEVLARFEIERQALARMDHQNVATMFSAGTTENGRPFFVMELVRGVPITQYCDERRLSVAQRVELLLAVCSAVQHAHQKGIVHRDLKPSNVLVTEVDGAAVPKVIDFGVAKATSEVVVDGHEPTRVGDLVGTPAYMSPEQAAGDPLDVDTRTDVYTLGVLLYQLITGTLPFATQSSAALAKQELLRLICEEEPEKPSARVQSLSSDHPLTTGGSDSSSLSRQIRGDLDWIVLKAMSKDRDRRYESASALAMDIERHLRNEPVSARSPGMAYRMSKFARRHTAALATAAAIALGLVVGIVYANAKRIDAENARADLEKVSRFQEGMLDAFYPFRVAERLQADLEEQIRAVAESEGLPESKIEGRLQAFESALDGVNLTDVSRRIIHLNVLTPAIAALDDGYADDPLLDAQLRRRVGQVYFRLSMFAEALDQFNRALQIRERELGRYHAQTISSRTDAGITVSALGEYGKAAEIYEQVLIDSRRVLGEYHPETLAALQNLATAARRRGDLESAEAFTKELVANTAQTFGEGDRKHLDALHAMGAFYRAAGRLREAADYYSRVLEGRRELLGEDHRDTMASMNNLAFTWQHLGEFDRSELLFREALAAKRRVLGDEHRSTLITLSNLGHLLRETGEDSAAESIFRETFAVSEKVLGTDHPDTLEVVRSIGNIAGDREDWQRAIEIYRDVIERQSLALGPKNGETLWTRRQLGKALESQGDLAAAEREMRDTLDVALSSLGATHPDTIDHAMLVGEFLLRRDRFDEAESMLKQATSMATESLGPAHRKSVEARIALGSAMIGQLRFTEAATHFEAVAEAAGSLPNYQNRTLARAQREWGKALIGLGRLERARELLLSSKDIFDGRSDVDERDVARLTAAFAQLETQQ